MGLKRYYASGDDWGTIYVGQQNSLAGKVNKSELVINARDFGVVGDGVTDDTVALQSALDASENKSLLIPPGDYLISNGVYLANNSTVYGYGATLHRGDYNFTMLRNYPFNDTTTTGYNGRSNIKLFGLTLDSHGDDDGRTYANVITFVHCKNMVVRDVTVLRTYAYHGLELNSVNNVLVDNCRFLGFIDDDGIQDNKEAVQIDCAITGSIGSGATDDTMAKNVTVRNCYFGADEFGNPAPYVAIGSHSTVTGEKYQNIVIEGCVSEGIQKRMIQAYAWDKAVITGCIATNALNEGYTAEECLATKFIGCVVDFGNADTGQGFVIYGGSSYCSMTNCTSRRGLNGFRFYGDTANLTIANCNTINTKGAAMLMGFTKDAVITGNTIVGAGYTSGAAGAIHIDGSDGVGRRIAITGNRVVRHFGTTEVSAAVTIDATAANTWVFGNDFFGMGTAISGTADTTSNRT